MKSVYVVVPVQKHLAGQHDQSSHGKWASGDAKQEIYADNVENAWKALLTDESLTLDNPKKTHPEKYNPTGSPNYGLKDGETELRIVNNSNPLRIREYETSTSAKLTLTEAMNVEGRIGIGGSGYGKPLVPVGSERPPQHVYRVMSIGEFNSAKERGYIKSNEEMNLASGEGTVTSLRSTGDFYAPIDGSDYRVVRIRYDDADGWQRDPTDGYIKTNNRIPFDRVDAFSSSINGNVKKHLAGQHDQSSHGSWANDGSNEISINQLASIIKEKIPYRSLDALRKTFQDVLKATGKTGKPTFGDTSQGMEFWRTFEQGSTYDAQTLDNINLSTEDKIKQFMTSKLPYLSMGRSGVGLYGAHTQKEAEIWGERTDSTQTVKMVFKPNAKILTIPSDEANLVIANAGMLSSQTGLNLTDFRTAWFFTDRTTIRNLMALAMGYDAINVTPTLYDPESSGLPDRELVVLNAGALIVQDPSTVQKHLAGQHDQSSHGNWANGGDLPYALKPVRAYHEGTLRGNYNDEIYGLDDLTIKIYRQFQISDPNIHSMPLSFNDREYDSYVGSMVLMAENIYQQQTGENPVYKENPNSWSAWQSRVIDAIKADPDYPAIPKEWQERFTEKIDADWKNSLGYKYAIRNGETPPPNNYANLELNFNNLNDVVSAEEFRDYVLKENSFVIKKLGEKKLQSGETISEVMDKIAQSQLSKLKAISTEQPVTVQTTSARLKSLIEDGRFKTVFEVTSMNKGTPRGAYLESRKRGETIMGVPSDVTPEQRPVYGYLTNANTESYGDVRIVLKEDVKQRTTMTVGDSLDGSAKAGFLVSDVRDSQVSSQDWWNSSGRVVTGSVYDRAPEPNFTVDSNRLITGFKGDFRAGVMYDYVETQVHGGVKVSDISQVIITNPTGIPKTLQNKLSRMGIEVIVEPSIVNIENSDYAKYGLDFIGKVGLAP